MRFYTSGINSESKYTIIMKKLVLAIIISAVLLGCKTEEKQIPKEKSTSQLIEYFESSKLPAAVMGSVSKDGEMVWKSFGPAVWGETDTINENNIFRIFSMTKAIASVAAMQLVEQGKIDLDDPLDELMPEMTSIPILNENGDLNEAQNAITLRHLLTHTAGFGYDFIDPRLQNFDRTGWEYEDLPRLFEAGERWQYGTSTDWVGKIVEKISGKDLESYIRENITGPLKMNSTWFNVPEELKENIVSWGQRDSLEYQEFPRIPTEIVTEFSAGGGLFASPKDYLTFLQCILNKGQYEGGQILKAETVESLFTNQLPDSLNLNFDLPPEGLPDSEGQFLDETDVHGLAWAIENSEDELVRSKSSVYWAGIANSYYTLDKEEGVAVVYFTQFLPFNDKISYDFYRLYEKEVYMRINE